MLAVKQAFGPIDFDLAADENNHQAETYFDEADDSLTAPWPLEGNLWLNPPYSKIAPWAKRCADWYGTGKIFLLVPASVGSEWYANHVENKAWSIRFLRPRLTFVGHKHPYPKDLMLAIYNPYSEERWVGSWRWK